MSMPLLFSGAVVIGCHGVSSSEKTRALEMKSNAKKSVRTRSCGESHLGKHRAASKPIFMDFNPLRSRGESTGVPASVSVRWDNHFCEDSEANLQLWFVWRSKSSVRAIRSMIWKLFAEDILHG